MESLELIVREKIGEERYGHTMDVVDVAMKLAKVHHASEEKVRLAALLHDYAKNISHEESLDLVYSHGIILDDISMSSTNLIHGPLGSKLAQENFNIEDQEILDAITYHTTGRENMSLVEKVIFLADFIEPGRDFKGIENIRSVAYEDLDRAILLALDSTIGFLLKKQSLLHLNTVLARNYLLKKGSGKQNV